MKINTELLFFQIFFKIVFKGEKGIIFSCNCTCSFKHAGIISFFMTVKNILTGQKFFITTASSSGLEKKTILLPSWNMNMYLIRMHVIFSCSVIRPKCFLTDHQYAKAISSSLVSYCVVCHLWGPSCWRSLDYCLTWKLRYLTGVIDLMNSDL